MKTGRTIDNFRRRSARRLRANATSAEAALWRHLRKLDRVVRFWNSDLVQNIDGVLDVVYAALYGSRDTEPRRLKHERRRYSVAGSSHPTPARSARRPSPSRGG